LSSVAVGGAVRMAGFGPWMTLTKWLKLDESTLMDLSGVSAQRAAVEDERRRTAVLIDGLQRSYADIVAAAELTSTDDEHDPEGATIGYERAQVWALMRQARADLVALDAALVRIDEGTIAVCSVCSGPIAVERLLALPQTQTCISCAT
jgi:DnaK suppressor protein